MKLRLALSFFLLANIVLAQKTIYFDQDWEETTKENASFYRTIKNDGSLFIIKDFFITGELQFEGVSKTETDPLHYEGKSTWYAQDQTVLQEINFKDNKKHGTFQTFYSDGTKKEESNYINDNLEGDYFVYFPSGDIQTKGTFKNNALNGKLIQYSSVGVKSQDIDFIDGLVSGNYTFYNSSGHVFNKGTALNGFKEGTCYDYFPSGELRQKYTIKDKYLDGDFFVFDTNGDTTTVGKFDKGKALSYQSTSLRMTNRSKFSSSMELKDTVEHWKTFRDGKLIVESFYKDGKKTGVWNVYSYDGNSIYETRDYSNSDCAEKYIQQEKEDGFDPFFLPTTRFSNSSDSILDDDCEGVVTTRNEAVSEDDHPFYYYKSKKESSTSNSEKSRILDYKEYAYSEEFLSKNSCKKGTEHTNCTRVIKPYTYRIFTSEDSEQLQVLKDKAQPKNDEIYFYYQTFEEREYDLSKNRPTRYMGFKLPNVIIEGLQTEIIDYIALVKSIEHDIFSVAKFSGLAAFDALEKEYKK